MDDEAGQGPLHVDDLGLDGGAGEVPGVGGLAARLGVEGVRSRTTVASCPAVATGSGPSAPSTARTVARVVSFSQASHSVGPEASRTARRAEVSPVPPDLRARASARARSRWSSMSAVNPARSTSTPCSAAISRVRSMGKP